MFRCTHLILPASISLLLGAAPAIADSLRCQSINGNLNCAGSNGVSCQIIDGHRTCTSAHGDVVQSFGGAQPSSPDEDLGDDLPPSLQMEPPSPGSSQQPGGGHGRPYTGRQAIHQD